MARSIAPQSQIDALASLAGLLLDNGMPLRRVLVEAIMPLILMLRVLLATQSNLLLGLSELEAVLLALALTLPGRALPSLRRFARRSRSRLMGRGQPPR